MKHSLLLVAVVALVAFAAPAHSQYMYLDVNGDGVNTAADILTPSSTQIDVYVQTDHNKDGSPVTCAQSSNLLTMNSYEVIMRATGSITYGTWTDLMSFATNLGDAQAGGDFYAGRGSGTILPPGLKHVGYVTISGVSAGTTVAIVSSTSASSFAETAFGSACEGNDFDNTQKLGSDWFDVSGTYSSTPTTATTWGHIKDLYK
jgi:hypothetical protein